VFTLAYVARIVEQLYFVRAPSGEALDAGTESDRGGASGQSVAADGGTAADGATGGEPTDADEHAGAPFGVVAITLAGAIVAVLLGFAGSEFADLLEPFLTEVLGQ
jgi:multicomponent Na+:H+ antiporter subunit D